MLLDLGLFDKIILNRRMVSNISIFLDLLSKLKARMLTVVMRVPLLSRSGRCHDPSHLGTADAFEVDPPHPTANSERLRR